MVNVDDLTGGPFHATDASGRNFLVGVERTAAATITVTDQKRTAMHTADDETLGDGDAPPAINTIWSGSGFERGTDEYVAVYTDIAAPTPIPFFDIDENDGRYMAVDVDVTNGIDAHTILQLGYRRHRRCLLLSLWGGNPSVLEPTLPRVHIE